MPGTSREPRTLKAGTSNPEDTTWPGEYIHPGAQGAGRERPRCRAGAAAAGASREPLRPRQLGSGGTLLSAGAAAPRSPAAWHRFLLFLPPSLPPLFFFFFFSLALSLSLSLPLPCTGGLFFFPPSSSLSLSEGSCQDAKLEIAAPDAFCAARRGSSFAGCCQWKDWQDPAGLPRPGPTSGRAPRFPRPSPALRGSSAPAPGLQSPPSHLRSASTFCMC